MARKMIVAALLTGTLIVSACNTVQGAKEDVNSAGRAVDRATDGE